MESHHKVLPPEVLLPQLLPLLEETDAIPLVISGNSMSPFLVHGRDTVFLSKVNRPLKRGDMILYQRDSGKYILHRIWRVENGSCTLVGDAQFQLEPGIRPEQVLAIVYSVQRKGKRLTKGDFWWEFFEKIWIRIVPLRRPIVRIYSLLARNRDVI